jgi:hypothetical protein
MLNQRDAAAPRGTGGCWPTQDQILVLRAALLDVDEALAAWTRWRVASSLDKADRGSIRLFPLVYRNLGAAGLPEPDLSKLKGAYRATWFRNQLILQRAAEVLQALHDAGLRTMLLKGVALIAAHYPDVGTRPMDDIDVLVPADQHKHALAVLERVGWSYEPDPGVGGRPAHAVALGDRRGWSLDLHRYALAQPEPDDELWAKSTEIELLGVPTRTLCPADQLFHVAAHGARWNAIPPVRWLADAVAIERSSGESLDWHRLVAEATRRRTTVALEAALRRLRDAVAFDVPEDVLERLRKAPKAPLERWTHRAVTGPMGGGAWAPVLLDQYNHASRVDPSVRLTPFLQDHFNVRTRRHLAGHLARKTVQAGVMQTALRVAPGRVHQCANCGRRFVSLRHDGSATCGQCDTGAV